MRAISKGFVYHNGQTQDTFRIYGEHSNQRVIDRVTEKKALHKSRQPFVMH